MYVISNSGCAGAIASATLFTILLGMCVTALTTVIIFVVKDKMKTKTELERASRTAKASNYEDIRHQTSSQAAIDTRKNVAYGHVLSLSTITTN